MVDSIAGRLNYRSLRQWSTSIGLNPVIGDDPIASDVPIVPVAFSLSVASGAVSVKTIAQDLFQQKNDQCQQHRWGLQRYPSICRIAG
ncbi:hypothetical protein Poly59_11170 [Rubripirellula reticaptiva]|uniref:Uncharacterized protein n=1 Tax=Rubripirellula reticaptiva TaxID=2528013 RepID=A0A5C6FC61_9BACT|nr:hypothetical protein Poly59_11170 [Rubripirellula reticaptiva]